MENVFKFALIILVHHISKSVPEELVTQSRSIDKHLVTIIEQESKEKTLFGYALATAKDKRNIGWVFIGAPTTNLNSSAKVDNNFKDEGCTWRCQLAASIHCNIVDLTSQRVAYYPDPDFITVCTSKNEGTKDANWATDDRICNGSLMGATVNFDHGIFLTCAPLWSVYKWKSSLRSEGACYWMRDDEIFRDYLHLNSSSSRTVLPFRSPKDTKFNIPKDADIPNSSSRKKWYYAESGFSSHITQEKGLVLGAPGVFFQAGSVVKMDLNGKSNMSFTSLENYTNNDGVDHLSILGYAVTSGKYLNNEITYVASSPRIDFLRRVFPSATSLSPPAVLMIKSTSFTNSDDLKNQTSWTPTMLFGDKKLFSYFGAALESVDLNNDTFDELLVGAPFIDNNEGGAKINIGDHGCIYIYSWNGNEILQNYTVNYSKKLCGEVPGGRFGSSIAKLGDIDQDDFNDFAVGAPYEYYEEYQCTSVGSVYIYYGDPNLSFLRMEKILGKTYSPNLKFYGFGFSISGGVDLDGNGTPDFTVGSWDSQHVAIFRVRPKLKIETSITFNQKDPQTESVILERNTNEVEIMICVSFEIMSFNTTIIYEEDMSLWANITIDATERRFFINNLTTLVMPFVISHANTTGCMNFTAKRFQQIKVASIYQPKPVNVQYNFWYNLTNTRTVNLTVATINTDRKVTLNGPSFEDFRRYRPYPIVFESISEKMVFRNNCRRREDNSSTEHICMPVLNVTLSAFGACGSSFQNKILENNMKLTFGTTPCLTFHIRVRNFNETAFSPRIRITSRWNSDSVPPATIIHPPASNCSYEQGFSDCRLDNGQVGEYLETEKNLTIDVRMKDISAVSLDPLMLILETDVYLEKDNKFQRINTTFVINYTIEASIGTIVGSNVTDEVQVSSASFYNFRLNISGTSPVTVLLSFLLSNSLLDSGKDTQIFIIELIQPPKGLFCRANDSLQSTFDRTKMLQELQPGTSSSRRVCNDGEACKAYVCNIRVSSESRFLNVRFSLTYKEQPEFIRKMLEKEESVHMYGFGVAQILKSDPKPKFANSLVTLRPPKLNKPLELWIVLVASGIGLLLLILLIAALYRYGFFTRGLKEKMDQIKAEDEIEWVHLSGGPNEVTGELPAD